MILITGRWVKLSTLLICIFMYVLGKVQALTTESSSSTDVSDTSQTQNEETTTDVTTPSTSAVNTTKQPLSCYQCSDTKAGEDCQVKTNTMSRAAARRLGLIIEEGDSGNDYIKDCAYSNYTYCMIETIANRGDMHSYIRDCSDGKTFSYDLPKLRSVIPDNQTTCSYHGQGYLVCVTLCESSFCNGPIPAAGSYSSFNLILTIPILVLHLLS